MNQQIPIIVIDDHDSLRRNLVALLEDDGFDVSEAASGEEALVKLSQKPVSVAIVDIRLNGMAGNEVMPLIHQRIPSVRFIVHTGSVDFVLTPEMQQLGLTDSDVFFKPISDPDSFLHRIRTLALCHD
jgi:DNA-binding NtrC family response regulator